MALLMKSTNFLQQPKSANNQPPSLYNPKCIFVSLAKVWYWIAVVRDGMAESVAMLQQYT